jgi:hypothetical protein
MSPKAFLIAVNIAKLPNVPRQILKDIPRPPRPAVTIAVVGAACEKKDPSGDGGALGS